MFYKNDARDFPISLLIAPKFVFFERPFPFTVDLLMGSTVQTFYPAKITSTQILKFVDRSSTRQSGVVYSFKFPIAKLQLNNVSLLAKSFQSNSLSASVVY